jgi:hypothetical protein
MGHNLDKDVIWLSGNTRGEGFFLFVEGEALDKQKIKPQITANPKEALIFNNAISVL